MNLCISYCKCWFLAGNRSVYYKTSCRPIVLPKLLKYFNGTLILPSFLPLFPVLPATFVLNLYETLILSSAGKLAIAPLAFKNSSSLQYRYDMKIFQMFQRNFHFILLNYTLHWHYYVNVFSITYLCAIYLTDVISKWRLIFNYYIFSIVWVYCFLLLYWFTVLHILCTPSFISTQFFVLNLVG